MIESFLTVGRQIITLYLLMAVGYVLGKLKLIDDHGAASMSTLVMYIVSPCMLLVAFQRPIEQDTLHNFYVVVAVSLLLHVAFIVLSRLMIHDTGPAPPEPAAVCRRVLQLRLHGYPVMTSLIGTIGVFYGSAYNVIFTFLSWTYGIYAITGDKTQLKLRPLLLNPGVISIVLALALYLLEITLPDIIMTPATYLSALNTPLPMVVVGSQLSHADFRAALKGASSWITMLLRLVAFPLLSLGICLALGLNSDLTMVLVIAASAPAAALLSMFASKFELDTELASSMVSVQTAFSALTMPLVVSLVDYLA